MIKVDLENTLMSIRKITPMAAAVGAAFLATATLSTMSFASENPFAAQSLESGYNLAGAEKEGKCGEGKCGENKKADKEGKCGEGKCGEGKKADKEGKCGEGKCGGAA